MADRLRLKEAILLLIVDPEQEDSHEAEVLLERYRGIHFQGFVVQSLADQVSRFHTPQLITPEGFFRGLEQIKYLFEQEQRFQELGV